MLKIKRTNKKVGTVMNFEGKSFFEIIGFYTEEISALLIWQPLLRQRRKQENL